MESEPIRAALERFQDGTPGAAEALARLLEPMVRRSATEVTCGWKGWQRDDFIDQALSYLLAPRADSPPRVLLYDPALSLRAWLAATLKNGWYSVLRRRGLPVTPLLQDVAAPTAPLDFAERANALGRPFSAADLTRIEHWKARERVELLCLAGLFPKVPSAEWERYLTDYEQKVRHRLARPFPPPAVLANDDVKGRTRPLAAALGIAVPNTLSVRWCNGKHLLWELEFLQDL